MLHAIASIVALVVVLVKGDHSHEVDKVGDCRDICTEQMCSSGPSPDDRLCSGFDFADERISVDPFHCGEPRCQQVPCGDCGDHSDCLATCKEFKRVNAIKGFPICAAACNAVPGDYKCWQRCGTFPEAFAKPPCDKYPCSEAFCTARGRQDCSAMGILVDPLSNSDNRCATVQCSSCGNHQDCLTHCIYFISIYLSIHVYVSLRICIFDR